VQLIKLTVIITSTRSKGLFTLRKVVPTTRDTLPTEATLPFTWKKMYSGYLGQKLALSVLIVRRLGIVEKMTVRMPKEESCLGKAS
jgi:hypothetical protein